MTVKSSQGPAGVLIVDDHPMMRLGLAQLISGEPDLCVCGEAATAAQALERIAKDKPSLVLLDLSLPDKNGLDAIKDIHALCPGLPVLVLSMHDEAVFAERVLRAGARGYIMKVEAGKRILEALRRVLAGQIWVSDRMSAQILETFSGRHPEASRSPIERLSDREFEVLELIGQGHTTREIAERLHLSTKTIETHRLNIKEKIGVRTGAELVRYAVCWVEARTARDDGPRR
jgi:DNA-binding NarL/FixJ family response regulator